MLSFANVTVKLMFLGALDTLVPCCVKDEETGFLEGYMICVTIKGQVSTSIRDKH
jgi:hypothetical protein